MPATRPRRATAVALAVAVAAPAVAPRVAPAQAPQGAAPGAVVRVLVPPAGWRRGELVALDSAHVIVRRDGWPRAGRVDTVPLGRVRRLEVRRAAPGRGGRAALGGLLGCLTGAAAGAYAGVRTAPGTLGVLFTAPLGGVLGAVLGAGVGVGGGRRWVPVALPAPGGG